MVDLKIHPTKKLILQLNFVHKSCNIIALSETGLQLPTLKNLSLTKTTDVTNLKHYILLCELKQASTYTYVA